MDIVLLDGVMQSVKIVAFEHLFFVKSCSIAIAIPFWKIDSFEKIKKREAKAALIIVLNVYYCFLFR